MTTFQIARLPQLTDVAMTVAPHPPQFQMSIGPCALRPSVLKDL